VNSVVVALSSSENPNSRLAPHRSSRLHIYKIVGQILKNQAHRSTNTPTRVNPPQHPKLTITMSRFFKGDSSSESSSSDEEELYSEEEEEEEKEESSEEDEDEEEEDEDSSSDDEDGKKTGANAFLKSADSESDESSDEEGTKVVKSAKDKRIEELEGTVKAIENGQKINDWGSISAGMRFWDKDSVDQGLTYGY
jgi:hypothetical protein